MKKLKLVLDKEILSKEQMKKIVGGTAALQCSCTTITGYQSIWTHYPSDNICPGVPNSYCMALFKNMIGNDPETCEPSTCTW